MLIYLADGSGDPFDTLPAFRVAQGAVTALALGDLDADGDLDLVVGVSGSNPVAVWLGDGAAGFTKATIPVADALGSGAESLAIGDVDGDGDLDVLVGASTKRLYRNDGVDAATGAWMHFTPAAASPTYAGTLVALGDLDGDGRLDLVVGGTGGSTVHLGAGDGTFAAATGTGTTTALDALTLADVNGDGALDLVLATAAATKVRLNQGRVSTVVTKDLKKDDQIVRVAATAGFAASGTLTIKGIGYNYSSLHANGTDFVLTTALTADVAGALGASVTTPWRGMGTAADVDGLDGAKRITLADLDGDGRIDAVTAAASGQPTWAVGKPNGFEDATTVAAVEVDVEKDSFGVIGEDIVLTVGGQTISVEKVTFSQSVVNGSKVVEITLTDGVLALDGIGTVEVDGALISTSAGVALGLTVTVDLVDDLPFGLDGTFRLLINSGAAPVQVEIDGDDVVLPGGPYLRVEVIDAELTIGDAVLAGSFAFEQVTTGANQKRTVILVSGVSVKLNAADPALLQNVTGALLLAPGGLAAQVSGSVNLAGLLPASVQLSGSFSLSINQGAAPVKETFTLGGSTVSLDLPAGDYLRVAATGVTLTIAGQTMTGDVAFEKSGSDLTLSVSKLTIRLGGATPVVSLTNGNGVLVLRNDGPTGTGPRIMVGRLTGTIAVTIPGVSVSGDFGLEVNTSTSEQGLPVGDDVDPGLAVSGEGVVIVIAGQRISGDFWFTQSGTGTARKVTLRIEKLDAFLGDDGGTPDDHTDGTGVHVTGDGSLLLTNGGVAADISATLDFVGLPSTIDIGDGIAVRLQLNTGTSAVRDDVLGINLPAGSFVRVEVGTKSNPLSITVAGQRLRGLFVIEQASTVGPDKILGNLDDGKALRLAATDVEVFLGDAGNVADLTDDVGLLLTGGEALLLLGAEGLAGRVSGSIALLVGEDEPAARADLVSLEINQRGTAVDESFVVGGRTLSLVLPKGPYLRASIVGLSLVLGGQRLSGDITVTRAGVGVAATTTIDFANVTMALGPAGSPVVRISEGEGTFTIGAGGVAGTLTVDLELDVPGVDLTGTFRVRINTGTETVNGIAPGFAVGATGVTLEVAGQKLTGGFEIVSDKVTGEIVLSLEAMTLRLGNGTETFVTLTLDGVILVARGGVAADLTATIVLADRFDDMIDLGSGIGARVQINTGPTMYNGREIELGDASDVDDEILTVPAGPFVRVQLTDANGGPVTITVAAQEISGIFVFEQVTTQLGTKVVRLGFSDAGMVIGVPGSNGAVMGVVIENASGLFILGPTGVAGEMYAEIGFTPALAAKLGASFTSKVSVQVNTGATAVREVITFDGVAVSTTREGTGSVTERQSVLVTVPTGSSWTLGYDKNGDGRIAASEITAALAHDATAGQVQAALAAIGVAATVTAATGGFQVDVERERQPATARRQRPLARAARRALRPGDCPRHHADDRHPGHQGRPLHREGDSDPHGQRSEHDDERPALRLRPRLHLRHRDHGRARGQPGAVRSRGRPGRLRRRRGRRAHRHRRHQQARPGLHQGRERHLRGQHHEPGGQRDHHGRRDHDHAQGSGRVAGRHLLLQVHAQRPVLQLR